MKIIHKIASRIRHHYVLSALLVNLILSILLTCILLFGIRLTHVLYQAALLNFVFLECFINFVFITWYLFGRVSKILKSGLLSLIIQSLKYALLFFIGIWSFFFIFLSLVDFHRLLKDGYDGSYLPVQTVTIDENQNIVVYRTNGGATTDFGVEIRREKYLSLGFKWVKTLREYYHVSDIKLSTLNTSQVMIEEVKGTSHVYTSSEEKWYGPLPVRGEVIDIFR